MKDQRVLLKWLARIAGILAIIFYILFLYRNSDDGLIAGLFGKFRSVALIFLFGIVGYVFALFREKEGGIFLLISGFLIGLYMFYSGAKPPSFMMLFYGLPFMIPGILFYYLGQTKES
ncbi:MAG: hypothetical protein K8R53_13955 [Bacteroidales bacterium]|nr:hypothetical protein [Bacteroidales bacterium]